MKLRALGSHCYICPRSPVSWLLATLVPVARVGQVPTPPAARDWRRGGQIIAKKILEHSAELVLIYTIYSVLPTPIARVLSDPALASPAAGD